jgi:ABC-type multidrug transport system fused ATPase/permease subunit
MQANKVLKVAKNDPSKLEINASKRHLFRRLFRYVWQNKLPFLFAFGTIFCLSVVQVLIPQITRYVIDTVIPAQNYSALPLVAGAILLVSLLVGILNFLRSYLMSLFGQKTVENIRNDLYKHIQKLSISFFNSKRTGDLMLRLAQDVNGIGSLVTSDVAEVFADAFTVIVILVYLFSTDWQLALMLLFTWPLMIYLTQVFGKFIRGAYRDVQLQAAAVNNQIQDTITNISVIKSFGNEQYEIDRFSEHSRNYTEANIRAVRLWSMFFPIIDVLNNMGNIIVIVFGALQVMDGKLSIGELAAVMAYVNQMNQPIKRFSRLTNVVQKGIVSLDRVFEILDTKPDVAEKEDAIPLTDINGGMKFEHVEFAYNKQEQVLHDFDLEIQPGTMVALVGSSGAGKSTIAKLAARFYDPTKGRVLIDNYDLRDVTQESLREQLGIVSQETLLLYGSVRDNIAYGKLDATEEEIIAAAKAANAHDFIMSFPDGYDTVIGERGVRLSGGQRQRLAIARVLLKNPRFVVLDEATSALDTESENLIQQSLEKLFKNRTSIVIAHRLSTIHNADLIVVMERGRILETGTHGELIAKGGRYAQLHALQFPQKDEKLPASTAVTGEKLELPKKVKKAKVAVPELAF